VSVRQILIPNERFKPRWYQRPFMLHFTANGHDGSGKSADWVVHRRGGKDLTGMHTLNICAHRRRGAYWHTFPTFEQGRKAIWEGFTKDGDRIIDSVFPEPLIRRRDNQQMVIELKCGSIYRILGTDKIEAVGAGPVGVLHSEYSIAKPKAADLIAPMLRENNGWEAYVYTPRGNNHGKRLFDRMKALAAQDPARYFCQLLTLYDTRAYDPEQTLADERLRGRPEALIRQEYLCDWTAANVGAVWGDLIEALEKAGAVAEFDFDKQRVFTTWDLGGSGARGDSTCFWMWAPTEDGADLLGYYESHGKTLSHYWDEVDRMAGEVGVRPVKHWLPHDARAKHLTGVSVLEQCAKHWGMERVAIYPEDNLLNGIQAGRRLLQRAVRIHPRCSEGLEALKAYHYGWDEDRKVFTNQPEHDWSSHGADGFRGLALVVEHAEKLSRPPKHEPRPAYVTPVAPTLDEMWEMQPKSSGRI
jgi:phage terminase large subunit